MNDSLKIHAPKPVKMSSKISGVKMPFSKFEKVTPLVHCSTPQGERRDFVMKGNLNFPCRAQLTKFIHLSDSNLVSRSRDYFSEINKQEDYFAYGESYIDEIKSDFEKLKDLDTTCKSEILSILRSNSSNFESSRWCTTVGEDKEYFLDDVRMSHSPQRPKNPFYKNFDGSKNDTNGKAEAKKEDNLFNFDSKSNFDVSPLNFEIIQEGFERESTLQNHKLYLNEN